MPRLSILVPLTGPVPLFENTLASVLQNRPADCDVLVVHPESYDDPWEVMDEVQLLETPVGVPLLEMLDASLPYVRGEFLHILQPGLEVTEGWADRALEAFCTDDVVAVSPWLVEAADTKRLAARGVSFDPRGGRMIVGAGVDVERANAALRARAQRKSRVDSRRLADEVLGPTLQAGFYRTQPLAEIGGWETSLGLAWADIDLALSFADAGFRCVESAESVILGPSEVVLAESQVGDTATFSERFAAGRCGERVYLRHSSRIDGLAPMVARGAGLFASWLTGGAARPSLAQVAGRMAAWSERPQHREFRKELAEWTATRRSRPIAMAKSIEPLPESASQPASDTESADRPTTSESVPRRAA